jgi:hypothetical protein
MVPHRADERCRTHEMTCYRDSVSSFLACPVPSMRRDALREALPGTVGLLKQCRAADVEDGFIADYVALQWLEWHGGTLRLTVVGQNICQQIGAGSAP